MLLNFWSSDFLLVGGQLVGGQCIWFLASSVLRKPDPKVIQQINFTGNLDSNENATIFFIIEEAKVTILDFSQETVIVL